MLVVFDIGGTFIKYALAEGDGRTYRFHQKGEMPTDAKTLRGPGIVERVLDKVAAFRESHPVEGVGISTAGIVDVSMGEITGANENIPDYVGVNWKKVVYDRFRLPCQVENDVNSAALGEYRFGAARGSRSMLCITVGTGVGGALILDGKLWHGHGGSAGEVGYMLLPGGMLENIASTTALVKRVNARFPSENPPWDGREIFARAKEGDAICLEEIERNCDYLAQGLANCCCLANPQTLVLGGGIMAQKDILRPFLEKHLQGYLPPPIYAVTRLAFAELGNDAGMIGAACLFLEDA